MVIFLAALAAEPDWGEDASPARLNLSFQRMLAPVRRLQRRKKRPPLADELVQLEREGSPAVITLQLSTLVENLANRAAQVAGSRPVASARLSAAVARVRGTRRLSRPSASVSTPNSVSTHLASGWRRKRSSVVGMGPPRVVVSSCVEGLLPSVKVTSVSSITWSLVNG